LKNKSEHRVTGHLPDVRGEDLWRADIVAHDFDAEDDLEVLFLPSSGRFAERRFETGGTGQEFADGVGAEVIQTGGY
jgi:hypothetical protein